VQEGKRETRKRQTGEAKARENRKPLNVDHRPAVRHNSNPVIDLARLESCTELTAEHAKQAASSSVEMRTFLKRVAEVAKPGEGCPKVLMAFAHLVGQEWVEGDLRVEVSGDDTSTSVAVMSEHGVGIRERLLPTTKFPVSIDEFERALELAPRMVLPLRITDEEGKIVLTPLAIPEERVKTMPPPDLEMDGRSLGDGDRTTAPPPSNELQVVDEAMPDLGGDDRDGSSNEITTAPPPPNHPALAEISALRSLSDLSGRPPGASATEDREVPSEGRSIHTRPTVRRMVAVDAAAIAAVKRRDPRREEE
jgi:hypothetical protein